MKILASDMDGTLIFHRRAHLRDLFAIRKFQKAGNKFGLCTGRFLTGAVDHNPRGLHPDFYIASSGAIILDKDLNVLFSKEIPYDLGEDIWNRYSKNYWMLVQTASREKAYMTSAGWKEVIPVVKVTDYSIVKNEHVHGLSIVVSTEEEAKEVAREIIELYKEVSPFVNKNSIDIVPKGCSKGNGVKFIQEYFKNDTVAGIGDSYNDLPMLEVADHSFTFKKSPKDIQEKVTHIVKSVAQAIQILMEE